MAFSGRLYHRSERHVPVAFRIAEEGEVRPSTYMTKFENFHLQKANKKKGCQSYGGDICDTSFDGICFETRTPLRQGEIVRMNMINFQKIPFGDQEFASCDARIAWCHKENTEKGTCYKVGAQRVREEKLPVINLKTNRFGSVKCF
jgi:hypothetical protein